MGWTAWSWYNTGADYIHEVGYPQLVSDYNGTPLASMGTYIYQQLLNYAGIVPPSPTTSPSPTPTLPPVTGPVSKIWYFAEGRAGHGFDEFLTLGNPTGNDCQVNITYLTQPDRGTGMAPKRSRSRCLPPPVSRAGSIAIWAPRALALASRWLPPSASIPPSRPPVAASWRSGPCTSMPRLRAPIAAATWSASPTPAPPSTSRIWPSAANPVAADTPRTCPFSILAPPQPTSRPPTMRVARRSVPRP